MCKRRASEVLHGRTEGAKWTRTVLYRQRTALLMKEHQPIGAGPGSRLRGFLPVS
jgi:hypothetical protein